MAASRSPEKGEVLMSDRTQIFVSDGEALQQDPVAQQHELLVSEIESTDGHLGTALRSVYDGPDPEKFLDRLDARIKAHNKEIERMCNHHYQGFIESVHSLLQVRGDVEKLKTEIQFINRELQTSGQKVLKRAEELVRYRKTQKNIELSSETLILCLPVLEMYGKLREQMANKRYYPALKTLEQLEHTYLPRVSKYRFSQAMCQTIPKMRDSIKDASMSDLKDFLESIRKHSARIGEIAMRQTAQENGMDVSLARKALKNSVINPFGGNEADDTDGEDGLNAQDLIDFSPVYRCLHIYSVLGTKDTFESYYRKQRRKQARLALQPPFNMHESLDGYKSYFHDIVGYFVVEDHILNTTTNLVNQSCLDELWDLALNKIVAVLRTQIGFCTDTSLLLQIKNLIMLFCLTLRSYGFSVSQLFELLLEVREQYSEILRTEWVKVFNQIFDEDNYTAITVETAEEYRRITDVYPFRDIGLEQESFPKRLPFSQFVPRVYSEVKKYISACLKFSEDLNLSTSEKTVMVYTAAGSIMQKTLRNALAQLIKRPHLTLIQRSKHITADVVLESSQFKTYAIMKICSKHMSRTEVDDMMRKFTNVLLTRTLGGCLAGLIRRPNLTLLQLIQISINMEYLDQSCIYLEDFISSLTGARQDNLHVSKLQGQSMFKSAKSDAESEIYRQINVKIDEFFELASYDWLQLECDNSPSEYITDLMAFLRGIFTSFTNLPKKVAETACMSACKHIAQNMMNLLMDKQVRCISGAVLLQLDQDLQECEKFADANPVEVLDSNTFRLAFANLRQLLNLFNEWKWDIYFADYGETQSSFIRVSPADCIVVLEKLKDADRRKNNLFTALKRNERDKKKLVDTVLKQLRQLVNGQHLDPYS